jgi:hypothetical protein
LKGRISVCMCEVWFPVLLPLFYLFPASIFYSVCCNLIISKEKHKVVIYLGVGDSEIFQHPVVLSLGG